MTPEQMADVLADEMMEDLHKIGELLVQFHDRYMQYSERFGHLVSDGKREQVEKALADFYDKLAPLAEEDE